MVHPQYMISSELVNIYIYYGVKSDICGVEHREQTDHTARV